MAVKRWKHANRLEANVGALQTELMERFRKAGVPRPNLSGYGDYQRAMAKVIDGLLEDMGIQKPREEDGDVELR